MNESKTISQYIAEFPQDVQAQLLQVYNAVKEVLPDAEEAISYGLPTFKKHGKNIIHFGGFKAHIGLYPTPGGIAEFREELSQYKGAKGSVQFPVNKPMPLDLVKRITLFRAKQTEENIKKK